VWVKLNRPVPLWWSLVFGFISIVALLGWLAAGDRVPFAFILGNAIVLALPIIFGGMAGVMSERVGVVNIAIEGQLLTGAFVAAVVSTLTGNLYLGMISAMVAAALMSMVLAVFAIRYLVDQIIVGVVLNVLVIGITNFLYSQWLTTDAVNTNSPGTFEIVAIPLLSDIPIIGPVLFENRVKPRPSCPLGRGIPDRSRHDGHQRGCDSLLVGHDGWRACRPRRGCVDNRKRWRVW
jgi:simple sugar transport system permease protein